MSTSLLSNTARVRIGVSESRLVCFRLPPKSPVTINRGNANGGSRTVNYRFMKSHAHRNLILTIFKLRMRPVPVVFLLLAFSDQLSKKKRKCEESVSTDGNVNSIRILTMTKTLVGVSALSASGLLDVVRRTPTTPAQRVGLVVPLTKTRRTLRLKHATRNSQSVTNTQQVRQPQKPKLATIRNKHATRN